VTHVPAYSNVRGDGGAHASGLEHDLTPGVASLELPVRVAHFRKGIDPGDGDLKHTVGDNGSELVEHVDVSPLGVSLGLHNVLLGRCEVGYRVDALRPDAELQRELDVPRAERVDEGADLAP
jgi:hypothetical protein